MARLGRISLDVVTVVSTLLCVATVVFWARSIAGRDSVTYVMAGGDGYEPWGAGGHRDPLAPEGSRNIDNYFNTANVFIPVSAATPNPFGNAGRNTVRSYAIYQTDLGLHKDFNLGSEKRKLEYRAEFFNLFNKTNFQAPNSTASSTAFGTIRSTFPARIIQMALRLSF